MSNSSHLPENCMQSLSQNFGSGAVPRPSAKPPLRGPPPLTRHQSPVSPPLVRHTREVHTYSRSLQHVPHNSFYRHLQPGQPLRRPPPQQQQQSAKLVRTPPSSPSTACPLASGGRESVPEAVEERRPRQVMMSLDAGRRLRIQQRQQTGVSVKASVHQRSQVVAAQAAQPSAQLVVQTSQQQQQQPVSVQLSGAQQCTLVSQSAPAPHFTHAEYSVVAGAPPPPPAPSRTPSQSPSSSKGDPTLLVVEAQARTTHDAPRYEANAVDRVTAAAAGKCIYMVHGGTSVENPMQRTSGVCIQSFRGGGPGGAAPRGDAVSGTPCSRGRLSSSPGEPPPPPVTATQSFDISQIAIEFEEPAVTLAHCREAVTSSVGRGTAQTLVEYVTAGQAGQTSPATVKRPVKTRITMDQYRAMKKQRALSLDSPLQYVSSESGQRYQAYGRVTSPILSGQLQANTVVKQRMAAVIDRSVVERSGAELSGPANTSPAGGGSKPAEQRYSPRLVAGKLAICTNCGHSSSDFHCCDYCRKPLPSSCKVIETAKSLAPAAVGRTAGQEVAENAVALAQNMYSRGVTVSRVRNTTARQTPLQPSHKMHRPKRRPAEEPECLTISSDEEGPAPVRGSLSGTCRRVVGASTEEVGGEELATLGVLGERMTKGGGKAAVGVEPCWQRDLLAMAADGSLSGGYVSERPRAVRVGSYRPPCDTPVLFSEQGTQLLLPTVSGERLRTVSLTLPPDRLGRVLAHFGPQLMVIFLYLTPASGVPVRHLLGMSDRGGPYFDPVSTEEAHKRITVIFEEGMSEESRITLMQVFRNSLGEDRVVDVNMAEANRILVMTSPPQMSASLQMHRGNTVQTLLQFPPPPASGAIAITTDDYCCLEEEQFLNDVIIDFYLKYLVSSRLAESDRKRTHVFSSFFYKRLTTRPSNRHGRRPAEDNLKLNAAEKRHARVKGWTKNVDIFDMDFLIVPINEHSHWFLAIICFPGLEGFRRLCDNQPCQVPEPRRARSTSTSTATARESAAIPGRLSEPTQIGNTLIMPLQPEPVPEQLDDSDRDEAEGDDEDLDAEPDEPGDQASVAVLGIEAPVVTTNSEIGAAIATAMPPMAPAHAPAASSEEPLIVQAQTRAAGAAPPGTPTETASSDAVSATSDGLPDKSPTAAVEAGDDLDLEKPIPAVYSADWPPTAVKQPCVLIFDSLAGASRSRVVATIRDYLRVEYSVKKGGQRPFSKDTIKGCCVKVPQQTNFSDCGVYVLQYVESFFENPIQDFHVPLLPLPRWFPSERPRRKREQLAQLIERLARRQNADHTVTLPRLMFNSASAPPAAAAAAVAAREVRSGAVLVSPVSVPRQVVVARPAAGSRFLTIPKQSTGSKRAKLVTLTKEAVLGRQTAATVSGPIVLTVRTAQRPVAPIHTSPATSQPMSKPIVLDPKAASPVLRHTGDAPQPFSPGPKGVVETERSASVVPKETASSPKPVLFESKQLVAISKPTPSWSVNMMTSMTSVRPGQKETAASADRPAASGPGRAPPTSECAAAVSDSSASVGGVPLRLAPSGSAAAACPLPAAPADSAPPEQTTAGPGPADVLHAQPADGDLLAALADTYASDSDDGTECGAASLGNGTVQQQTPPASGPRRGRGRPPRDYALMVGCKRRQSTAKGVLRSKTPRKS